MDNTNRKAIAEVIDAVGRTLTECLAILAIAVALVESEDEPEPVSVSDDSELIYA